MPCFSTSFFQAFEELDIPIDEWKSTMFFLQKKFSKIFFLHFCPNSRKILRTFLRIGPARGGHRPTMMCRLSSPLSFSRLPQDAVSVVTLFSACFFKLKFFHPLGFFQEKKCKNKQLHTMCSFFDILCIVSMKLLLLSSTPVLASFLTRKLNAALRCRLTVHWHGPDSFSSSSFVYE